jgi:hypothetical protein
MLLKGNVPASKMTILTLYDAQRRAIKTALKNITDKVLFIFDL